MNELAGKVVVVTGASQGLGQAIAWAANRAGARVVLAARQIPPMTRLAEELGGATVVRCDVMAEDDRVALIDAATSAYGRVDVLVNNAGIASAGPATGESLETGERIIATNLTAVLRLCQIAATGMIDSGGAPLSTCRHYPASAASIVTVWRRMRPVRPG